MLHSSANSRSKPARPYPDTQGGCRSRHGAPRAPENLRPPLALFGLQRAIPFSCHRSSTVVEFRKIQKSKRIMLLSIDRELDRKLIDRVNKLIPILVRHMALHELHALLTKREREISAGPDASWSFLEKRKKPAPCNVCLRLLLLRTKGPGRANRQRPDRLFIPHQTPR